MTKPGFLTGDRVAARRLWPFFVLVCAIFDGATAAQAQSPVPGNMIVEGELEVQGNNFNLGTWSDDPTKLGLNTNYLEDSGHAATLTFTANRPVSTWLWQKIPATGTVKVPQMRLSSGNALTLFDQTTPMPNATIVLDPAGTSTLGTSVLFNGTNNRMPNQTYIDNATVLTVGLADARYPLQTNGSNLSLGAGATATGSNLVALGAGATANGANDIALGNNASAAFSASAALGFGATAGNTCTTSLGSGSTANGPYATSVGAFSIASASNAVALGTGALASDQRATALGMNARATADSSLAVGEEASATGFTATSIGQHTLASGYYSTVVGHYTSATGYESSAFGIGSIASGYQTTALGFGAGVSGSAATAVGVNSAAVGAGAVALGSFSRASGDYATALTSSSLASGDYAVSAGQTEAASFYQFSVGRYGTATGDPSNWVATDDLFTVGNGDDADSTSNAFVVKKNGNTEVGGKLDVAGKLTVSGPIIVSPQGDLQMGEFTAQPSPTP